MKIKVTKLDKLWADCVKQRDGYRCRRCGRTGKPRGMHAAHIEGRSKKSTRWALENGLCLCFLCHQWFDQHKGIRDEWMAREGIMTHTQRDYLRLMSAMTWDKDTMRIEYTLKHFIGSVKCER